MWPGRSRHRSPRTTTTRAALTGAALTGTTPTGAALTRTTPTGTTPTGAALTRSTLTGATLTRTTRHSIQRAAKPFHAAPGGGHAGI